MVISPTSYPVVHHFSIVRADVVNALGDDRPIVVAASTSFRRSRTDRTRAFEVVPIQEIFLTLVGHRRRLQDFLEVANNCDLFAFRYESHRSDLARECVFIPSEHRIGATASRWFAHRHGKEGEMATPVIDARECVEDCGVKDIVARHTWDQE